MILRILVIAIVLYFLFRFVFNFVLPVAKATRQMKNKMNEFNNRMQEQQNPSPPQTNTGKTTTPKGGDYIDFEEVN